MHLNFFRINFDAWESAMSLSSIHEKYVFFFRHGRILLEIL